MGRGFIPPLYCLVFVVVVGFVGLLMWCREGLYTPASLAASLSSSPPSSSYIPTVCFVYIDAAVVVVVVVVVVVGLVVVVVVVGLLM